MLVAGNPNYGISKGLSEIYPNAHYCSRSSGYDLCTPEGREQFAELSKTQETVILVSTLADFAQTMLLDCVYTVCKQYNPRCHIIVVSSSTDRISKGMHWLYNTEKKSVRDLANSLGFVGDWETGPKVSRISFGAIEHKKYLHPDWNFIDIHSAAQYIKWIVDQPRAFNVFELGVEPMQNNEWWND